MTCFILWTFVIYRVTKRNVGPWGSPQSPSGGQCTLASADDDGAATAWHDSKLTATSPAGRRRLRPSTTRATHSDLVRRFLGPLRADPLVELSTRARAGSRSGLFSNSRMGHRVCSVHRPPAVLRRRAVGPLDVADCRLPDRSR